MYQSTRVGELSPQLLPAETVILSRTASVGFAAILGVPMATTQDFVNWICGERLRPNFLLYVFRAMKPEFGRLTNGSVHQTIYMPDVAAFRIPLPPVKEQDKIAAFLDRETSEADALVAKYERLIELLEEKRVALISQAVTRGIDPSASMKESGIAWIGEIPEHWQISQLRRYYEVIDCKHVTVEFQDDGIPVVSVREVKDFCVSLETINRTSVEWFDVMTGGGRLPRRGDVIFCRNVSPGTCSFVDTDERFAMGQDVCLIRPRDADGRYLTYVMRSDVMRTQIGLASIGSTFNRINVRTVESLIVPQPARKEQAEIAAWLDCRFKNLDAQLGKCSEAIQLVQEHRSALITAAVTGKIDVNSYRIDKQPIEVPA